ncbi:iron chelate uptake ABC transporter family permease subunit [Micrococcales bacterium 31B]|nr:iron chelate uptake ABC transporter family permease subunit [Micrococcales bacterium 31B]
MTNATTRASGPLATAGRPRAPLGRPALVVLGLAGLVVALAVAFMTVNVVGSWEFVIGRRRVTLATLLLVAVAVGVSTVVFHTITENRILTPSIMGFDALYVLIQTVLVFTLGISVFAQNPYAIFGLNAGLMVAFSVALFGWLLIGARRTLHALLLIGIILGGVFRSGSGLANRMLSPDAFIVLQDMFFASFNAVDPTLLGVSTALILLTCGYLWTLRHQLDCAGLGRSAATSLGVNHRALVLKVLIAVSILVSVSTALVGPTTFFGLLVAHLAYSLTGTHRHAYTIPAAVLAGAVCLVGGQMIVQHVFNYNTALSIVIDFAGGLVFVLLLLRKKSL